MVINFKIKFYKYLLLCFTLKVKYYKLQKYDVYHNIKINFDLELYLIWLNTHKCSLRVHNMLLFKLLIFKFV